MPGAQPEPAHRLMTNTVLKLCSFMILLMVVTLATGCRGDSDYPFVRLAHYDPLQRYYPEDHWAIVPDPESVGWSSADLEEARRFAKTIHSSAVVIIENGVVIAGWGNLTSRYKLHSVRKSLMSVMYGIAIEDDLISLADTLEQLAINDRGGLTATERQATIHDLLTSRSGVYHPAAYETAGMREKRPARGSHAPGSFWYYNNWDFNVLSTIYNQQTGQDFFRAFNEKIAAPLRMEHFRIADTSYHYDASYSVHPAYLFRMSALDLARFGLLCLREGQWRDERIVSQQWLALSTKAHTVFNPSRPARGYGYLWWVDEGLYYASGTGGQRLFVWPERNLIVVHRTDTDSKVRIRSRAIRQLVELILQARFPEPVMHVEGVEEAEETVPAE